MQVNNRLFEIIYILMQKKKVTAKELADKFDSDIYILPSSIHETLLIPADGEKDAEELKDMVRTINATEVSPEEVLSDNVYVYIRATERVEMA